MELIYSIPDPIKLFMWLSIWSWTCLSIWRKRNTVGLTLLYMLFYFQTHFLSQLIIALPWYNSYLGESDSNIGFDHSLLGIIAFSFGVHLLRPIFQGKSRQAKPENTQVINTINIKHLEFIYLFIGLISFFFLTPFLRIATLQAILSHFDKLVNVAILLFYWQAFLNNNQQQKAFLIFVAILWPINTIFVQGFLGFGLNLTFSLLALIVCNEKINKRFFLFAAILAYFIFSFTVTYFETRGAIRDAVWGGESYESRIEAVFSSITRDFSWFDVNNNQHLQFLEERSNFNFILGRTILRLNYGVVSYANGSTIIDALYAMLPRALWPDKPFILGGNILVAYYSGITFDENTSVSMGHLMDSYVNFGFIGMLVCLTIFGAIISMIDMAAKTALENSNKTLFAMLFLCGSAFLSPSTDFLELSLNFVSSFVSINLLNLILELITARQQRYNTSSSTN